EPVTASNYLDGLLADQIYRRKSDDRLGAGRCRSATSGEVCHVSIRSGGVACDAVPYSGRLVPDWLWKPRNARGSRKLCSPGRSCRSARTLTLLRRKGQRSANHLDPRRMVWSADMG